MNERDGLENEIASLDSTVSSYQDSLKAVRVIKMRYRAIHLTDKEFTIEVFAALDKQIARFVELIDKFWVEMDSIQRKLDCGDYK